jgi:hypothetical protein
MSEFSASMHLQSATLEDAVALLRAAQVPGYVFPANDRWVPFVYSAGAHVGSKENFERIVGANRGLLLTYDYAADHGCWVGVYRGPARIARIEALFEVQRTAFEPAEFVRLGLLSVTDAEAIGLWIASAHRWEARPDENAHIVAEKLGLSRYAWFAHAYECDADSPDEERVEVDALGNVKTFSTASGTDLDIDELLRSLPPTKKSAAAVASERRAAAAPAPARKATLKAKAKPATKKR